MTQRVILSASARSLPCLPSFYCQMDLCGQQTHARAQSSGRSVHRQRNIVTRSLHLPVSGARLSPAEYVQVEKIPLNGIMPIPGGLKGATPRQIAITLARCRKAKMRGHTCLALKVSQQTVFPP